ncbi:MAG: glycosyltransferase [Candidatus Omnitrophica bacterium]|nr:glycosyltransferase [Candidatus Omnitrophota bacterium]
MEEARQFLPEWYPCLANVMKFSIIIPAYNSEKYIKACLDSIFNLNYPKKDYEVIVVDGGSKDTTLNILKKYKVKVVHSKNISIANSRNLGAKEAKGDTLVFIDSDCLANKELLKKAEEHLKKYSCCGAFYKPSKTARWVAKGWLMIEGKNKGIVNWIPSGTLIVKKSVFFEIDGFNEMLQTGEDFDFCLKLKNRGYKIFNDPSVASIHLGQTDNLKDFFKKEMWRGSSLIKSLKESGIPKEKLPSTFLTTYHFLAVFLFMGSLFINIKIVILFLLILIIPSFLLTIRKTIQTKKIDYFFKFYILLWVYQIARAISIIRYNQFRDLF